ERGEVARVVRDLPVRSQAFTPLLREGGAIGVMIVTRSEVRPFQQNELDLMVGFADQAVIAIENTRLFEAEQASKRELQESLEYQTAISDVLNVISRSPATRARRHCQDRRAAMPIELWACSPSS